MTWPGPHNQRPYYRRGKLVAKEYQREYQDDQPPALFFKFYN